MHPSGWLAQLGVLGLLAALLAHERTLCVFPAGGPSGPWPCRGERLGSRLAAYPSAHVRLSAAPFLGRHGSIAARLAFARREPMHRPLRQDGAARGETCVCHSRLAGVSLARSGPSAAAARGAGPAKSGAARELVFARREKVWPRDPASAPRGSRKMSRFGRRPTVGCQSMVGKRRAGRPAAGRDYVPRACRGLPGPALPGPAGAHTTRMVHRDVCWADTG